ncbi:MAG: metallophosphoesterase [Gammaproteobacteria bacterium]|nr:metallophosphoesterase [Gammaproteobacteria bacterium]MBU1553175.1 metallophosphoesterase [Gammaproteobacteria bacterium]MBU2071434.1 metallophosphoesterase [Gammaproteobacteria bacterium]MBU2182446.1 metallophosphoesterase [Gammaproteobacteria bacterium]MBU2204184.1 metallophosphoesterase [Gammaproteobacteria bacterium]
MKLITPVSLTLLLSIALAACSPAEPAKTVQSKSSPDQVVLRFAVLGDAEPKPEPQFPHLAAAVADVNRLATQTKLDFVVGVGDIAHKGALVQYDNVTPVLQQLTLPFYPIMGNEEHGSTVERFMQYANSWNAGKIRLDAPSYVLEFDTVALVFASPDHGRDFNDSGIAWMLSQLTQLAPKPVLLIVHGAQTGVYPENADKGISHPGFAEVIAQPNLAAVISGDLHMDMDRVVHSKQLGKVHYLHIPALERTKIPDETQHTAMFRLFSLSNDGIMQVDTYQTGIATPLQRHSYQFSLNADH